MNKVSAELQGIREAERLRFERDDFLSREELDRLTPEIVIERVRKLKPFIASHARRGETSRIPSQEVWKALRATGYFYLFVPKMFGGLEANYDEMLDATFPLCEADPSVGWLCSFLVTNPRSAAGFSDEVLEEMYGGNRYVHLNSLFAPFGKAVRVDGGYRVSGVWHWGTTVQMADWVSAMAFLHEDGGEPRLCTFLMPADEVTIWDTWKAHGLVATGTHKVSADGVFVPSYRMVPYTMIMPEWLNDLRERFEYPIFIGDLTNALSLTIATPVVGIARGALMAFKDHLRTWVKRGTDLDDSQAENPLQQARLARVTAQIQSAELLVRHCARTIYSLELVHKSDEEQKRASDELRGSISYATVLARQAVIDIAEGAGTSIHDVDHPLQMYLRDIFVGSSHLAVEQDTNMVMAGRALLGLKPKPASRNVRSA